jgi:hypothetical protein
MYAKIVLALALTLVSGSAAMNPPDPIISVHGGSPSELHRLNEALAHFAEAGLAIPPLQVHFVDDESLCPGRFNRSESPWRISICVGAPDWVYEHELAHAWEAAHVNDQQREMILDLLGLETWRDRATDWSQRGVEWAAVVIQQGLNGIPLPPTLSLGARLRVESFEILTGRVAPTLVSWIARHDVPCSDRPTPLTFCE